MIHSLYISKPVTVRPNSRGKLNVPTGAVLADGKADVIHTSVQEVVSISYHFEDHDDIAKLPEYVRGMQKIFPHTLHVVHLDTSYDSKELVKANKQFFDSLPLIVHLPVFDRDIENGTIADIESFSEWQAVVEVLGSNPIDRYMLDDLTTSMYTDMANRLRKQAADMFGTDIESIGICGSPLSDNELCCLSARLDREWAAKYVHNEFVVLPSANHQNMERCGCLRFVVIEHDVITLDAAKSGGKSSGGHRTPKAPKIKAPKRSARAVRHP